MAARRPLRRSGLLGLSWKDTELKESHCWMFILTVSGPVLDRLRGTGTEERHRGTMDIVNIILATSILLLSWSNSPCRVLESPAQSRFIFYCERFGVQVMVFGHCFPPHILGMQVCVFGFPLDACCNLSGWLRSWIGLINWLISPWLDSFSHPPSFLFLTLLSF